MRTHRLVNVRFGDRRWRVLLTTRAVAAAFRGATWLQPALATRSVGGLVLWRLDYRILEADRRRQVATARAIRLWGGHE